jgi:hypothetical protein
MLSIKRALLGVIAIVCLAVAPVVSVAGCTAPQQKAALVAGLDTYECVLQNQGQGLTAEQLAMKCGLAEVGDVIRIITAAERASKAGFMKLPDAGAGAKGD